MKKLTLLTILIMLVTIVLQNPIGVFASETSSPNGLNTSQGNNDTLFKIIENGRFWIYKSRG
ncbi:MAG: hypothetical protein ACYCYE_00760 [Clostridia bacterium]